jgi:hypothetical protein
MQVAMEVMGPLEREQCTLAWSRIIVRSWADEGFRQQVLQADEHLLRQLCREEGYELPAQVALKVYGLDTHALQGGRGQGPAGDWKWALMRIEAEQGQEAAATGGPGESLQRRCIYISALLPPAPEAEEMAIAIADYGKAESPRACCIC